MAAAAVGVKRSFREMQANTVQGSFAPAALHASHPLLPAATARRDVAVASAASRSQSPDADAASARTSRRFEADASIVLIGVRGVGKSSLGFLASAAYTRRLIEADRVFFDETGETPIGFRKAHGSAAFHQRHSEIFKHVLEANGKNCVIVCSFADLENDGARVLQDYARSHPVIHVMRAHNAIQSHVQVWTRVKVDEIVRASKPMLRACTNYEFFNVDEDMEKASVKSLHTGQLLTRITQGPFLTLKRAEHDFLKLLRNVVGDDARHSSHRSFYPLSEVNLEDMEYPSVVRLSVADVASQTLDLDEAQIGADAIELEFSLDTNDAAAWKERRQSVLDSISEAFAILRRTTILPIVTSSHDDIRSAREQAVQLDVVEHYLRLGPEYCRVNLQSDDSALSHWLTNKGRTQLIGSFAAAQRARRGWQDGQWSYVYDKGARLGFDFLDFSMPAEGDSDSSDALSFPRRIRSVQRGSRPLVIANSTGRFGRSSMCLNPAFTTVRATNKHEQDASLVTAKQRNQALFAALIHDPLHFFIYGADVGFSLSPAMHNTAYRACGMSHRFGMQPASGIDDLARLVREPDFGGAAVVQPFKTTVLPLMDQLSPQARAIGAVNTVIAVRDGGIVNPDTGIAATVPGRNRAGPAKALYGDNTDWIGIRACVRRSLSPANTVRAQSTALVCGAGGMARAAIFALMSLGVKNIFVCNRTPKHADAVSTSYNQLIASNAVGQALSVDVSDVTIEPIDSYSSAWPSSARHPTIIVSCIPTQTAEGTAVNFTLPLDWLASPTGGVVVELAYMPVVTPLVLQIRELAQKGWILMDGLDVLPEQAFAQFELFTGRRAPRKLMRDEVFKRYSEEYVPARGALNTDSPTQA